MHSIVLALLRVLERLLKGPSTRLDRVSPTMTRTMGGEGRELRLAKV